MACELIDWVARIDAAYMDLRRRCAPTAPGLPGDPCIVPRLMGVWGLGMGIAQMDGITEVFPRPEIPGCLSVEFLRDMLDWLNGMTCVGGEPDPDGYYYRHILYFVSTEGYFWDDGLGGAMQGWSVDTWVYDWQALPPVVNRPGQFALGFSLTDNLPGFVYSGAHWSSFFGGTLAGDPADPLAEWQRMLSPTVSKWMYVVERYSPTQSEPLARLALVSNLTDWDMANLDNPTVAAYRVTGTRSDVNYFSEWRFDVPEDIHASF
jgi:hypothetical protein